MFLHFVKLTLDRFGESLNLNSVKPVEQGWKVVALGVYDLSVVKVNFWLYFIAFCCMVHMFLEELIKICAARSFKFRIKDVLIFDQA